MSKKRDRLGISLLDTKQASCLKEVGAVEAAQGPDRFSWKNE